MKKKVVSFLTSIMVLSMIVGIIPNIGSKVQAQIEMPEPIEVYTMDESTEYTVLEDGCEKVEIVEDYNAETGAGKGKVLKVPASSENSDTEIRFKNPFAGLDLTEGEQTAAVRGDNYEADEDGMPIWNDGIAINYWIKTVDDTNSVVMNFYNNDRLQMNKDDYRKHLLAVEAKEAYDESIASGEPIDSRFTLGDSEIYIDEYGKEYIVYSGGGTYMRFNPDYEEGYIIGTGEINAYRKGSDPDLSESWVTISSIGSDWFEEYYEPDYEKNPNSKCRYGYTDGYLQLSLDGSVAFLEDDGSGTNLNPNLPDSKPEFNIRNSLDFFGSTTLTEMVSAENDVMNWHMVTIVIQNDWIDYYIDGEHYNSLADEFKWYNNLLMNLECAGKSFNAGFGLRTPFHRGPSSRTDCLSGNRSGLLLTEWLSLENTTFSIGGVIEQAQREEKVAEFYIDDVAFYDTILNADQIYELYLNGINELEGIPTPEPTADPIETEDTLLNSYSGKLVCYESGEYTYDVYIYATGNLSSWEFRVYYDGATVLFSAYSADFSKKMVGVTSYNAKSNGYYGFTGSSANQILFDNVEVGYVRIYAEEEIDISLVDGISGAVLDERKLDVAMGAQPTEPPKYVEFVVDDKIIDTQYFTGSVYTATAPEDPVKEADAQYTYKFIGWDRPFDNITENTSVNAVFEKTLNKYDVMFVADSVVLKTDSVEYGKAAAAPENPVKASDDKNSYRFLCWDKSFDNITGTTIVTAIFEAVPAVYEVLFVSDGKIIDTQNVEAGKGATAPKDPTKTADDNYTYVFKGWDREFDNITGDLVVTAVFEAEELIKYTLGDINQDSGINATDALLVLKQAAKISNLSEVQLQAADVNKDNQINAADALLILKVAARLVEGFE